VSITFIENVLLEPTMTTTITVKGQVTLPKKVRDAVGLKPGDKVEVRATASGGVYIEKPGAQEAYKANLYALAERRLIRGITTDELMEMSRGESKRYRPKKK
jgi:AbrB family looped-hinge helix DNA binding protein